MLAFSLLVGASSFANGEETISQRAEQSFKKDFTSAKDVKWQKTGELVKATFSLNEKVMFAYYNVEGDLVAITRNITTEQLPISLLSSVKKSHGDYWISDLFEMVSGGSTTYYITLENADQKLVLKSDDFNDWLTYKKEKKSAD